jgi:hypothetical protein
MTRRYSPVPRDFPRAELLDEFFANYQVCEELVRYTVDKVRKEQLRGPLIPTPEIVSMHLETARRFGWGFQGELEWVFRNVVRELGCDLPRALAK